MPGILVLANETIGGQKLLDAIRERAQRDDDPRFHVVVPLTRPRHGNVIYDEAVRDSAQVRVNLALAFMREEDIHGTGEVGDQDPLNAAKDAIAAHRLSEIIVSTLPSDTSNWVRRHLPDVLHDETGLPVEHVVVDLEKDGLPFDVTLVVANQTASSPALVERLEQLNEAGPHRFIIVVPQDRGMGPVIRAARERLKSLLASLKEDHIVAAGMIGDPDPFIAVMNACQFFHVSEIIISTLPRDRSKWMADKLVERVDEAVDAHVFHIEQEPVNA
jgi:hypothetical protein